MLMKKVIVLFLLLAFFLLLVFSIYKELVVLTIVSIVLLALLSLYIMYKIWRKFRGKVIVDESRRSVLQKDIKKVSVVIPNYNYANYIEERINSILEQTYPIYELIILDDKSTDNSVDVIKKIIKKIDKKIKVKLIVNDENSGNVFKQWQKAFKESSGDYLWICEADDLCNKYFLNVAMQGFDDDKVILSYTESKEIDQDGKIVANDFRHYTDTYNIKLWNNSFIIDGKEFLDKSLAINNSIVNVSGVVFKKDKNIPVDEYLVGAQDYKLSGDWYFYCKYLLHGYIAYSSDSLNYHRIHKSSITTKTDNKLKYEEISSIQKVVTESINVSPGSKYYAKVYRDAVRKL